MTDEQRNQIIGQWLPSYTLSLQENTDQLHANCKILCGQFLFRASEYELEKFIKSYCEPIVILEGVFFRNADIDKSHPPFGKETQAKYLADWRQAEQRTTGELIRHFRHWLNFLNAVRMDGYAAGWDAANKGGHKH